MGYTPYSSRTSVTSKRSHRIRYRPDGHRGEGVLCGGIDDRSRGEEVGDDGEQDHDGKDGVPVTSRGMRRESESKRSERDPPLAKEHHPSKPLPEYPRLPAKHVAPPRRRGRPMPKSRRVCRPRRHPQSHTTTLEPNQADSRLQEQPRGAILEDERSEACCNRPRRRFREM